MDLNKNLIKHWANLFESEEMKMRGGDCMLGEKTNPDGTIDDVSFQGDGESVFAHEILALMFRGLGYTDLVDSNGMMEHPDLAFRCGMGRLAMMKCQIKAVDMGFDKVLGGREIQRILKEKL